MPCRVGGGGFKFILERPCWYPCLTAMHAWSSSWGLWGGGILGGSYKPGERERKSLGIQTSFPHFTYGETEARKKSVIYLKSWFAKSMLKLELVSLWVALFSRTQECPAYSKWHMQHSVKSESSGLKSKACHLIAFIGGQISEPQVSHL